jgi:nucleoside-diphosphate-sugar epimerase
VRVVVVGGTGFIGRAIVRALAGAEHRVTVVHRGEHEIDDEPGTVAHLHAARKDFASSWHRLPDADVLVDVAAYTREDARLVLDAAMSDSDIRFVVLSSMDVYAVWASFMADGTGSERTLDETAPLRESRYLYRERSEGNYEKLDVEEEYLARGAIVLRLPMIYGEHDDKRREDFILRRCLAWSPRLTPGRSTTARRAAASRLGGHAGRSTSQHVQANDGVQNRTEEPKHRRASTHPRRIHRTT